MEHIDKVKGIYPPNRQSAPQNRTVSTAVIRRLPRYHRYLGQLLREGKARISSLELSQRMCVTASQIRQDLNCFGGFGQQGYGYHVQYLYDKIGELLGVNEHYSAVFVGLGHLGHSLVSSAMLERRGILKLAIFEKDPALVGQTVAGLPVLPSEETESWCRRHKVDLAVLAVPREQAQPMAEALARAGVRGIWNFSDTELDLHIDGMEIENMHLSDALLGLCYRLRTSKEPQSDDEREEDGQ